MAEPLLLSVREAGHLLRVGRDTAYALARTKQIPVIRIGKRLLVPREALLRWVESQAQPEGGYRANGPAVLNRS